MPLGVKNQTEREREEEYNRRVTTKTELKRGLKDTRERRRRRRRSGRMVAKGGEEAYEGEGE